MAENTPITETELDSLRSSKSADEWNATCKIIKGAREGLFPTDWFATVMQSGLMASTAASWGSTGGIKVISLPPPKAGPDA